MSVRVAQPQRRQIVPAFTVEKLSGDVERTIIGKDENDERIEKKVKVPAGYLVKFPTKGHSIRIGTDKELKRLGFDKTIPLVDANSDNDDIEGEIPNDVLKK